MQSGKYSVTVILVNTKNISMNWLLFIEPGLFWWLTHTGIWLLKTSSFETLRHFVPRCTAFTFKSRDRMRAIRPSPTVWSGSWRRHQIGLTCWSFSKLRLSYDVHILPLGRCDRLVFVLQWESRSAKYIFRRVQMVVLNSIFSFLLTAYHLLLFQQPEPADVVMIQHSNKVVFFKMLFEAALKH